MGSLTQNNFWQKRSVRWGTAGVLLAYTAAMVYLHTQQLIPENYRHALFWSDAFMHLVGAQRGESYSLNGFCLLWLDRLAGPLGCGVFLGLVDLLGVLAAAWLLCRLSGGGGTLKLYI